ncbi:MAG: DUF898 domain-containing protein [Armatimonadetes bacterium]|nr:DUF898 domain-containing protein [Armatimonadota bacterium]
MNEVVAYAAPPPAPLARRLSFHGSGGPLFGIFIRNLFLTILTLGIYYFWGKVRARRYILGQVEFEGDRFAYHATGRELLLGWLKVAGFFAWLYVMQIVIPLVWKSPFAGALLGLGVYVVFLFVYPIAIVGSRRFRLSRTSWRGIRFSFRGRARDFVRLYVGGNVLTFLTFGLYYAHFQNNIRRFLIPHSHFGTTRFDYDGRGQDLLGLYILAAVVTGATLLGVGLVVGFAVGRVFFEGSLLSPAILTGLVLPIVVGLLGLSVFWLWFLGVRHRYYWGRTFVSTARFRSTVTTRRLAGLLAGDALRLIPTLGLAWPWVVVRHIRFTFANLVLEGPLDIEAIHQEAQAASAAGESLADFLGLLDIDLGL